MEERHILGLGEGVWGAIVSLAVAKGGDILS